MKTKRIKIYSFEELNEEAQKVAIKNEIESLSENIDLEFFKDDCTEQAKNKGFDITKLVYSLSNCQGDGVSFSADIDIRTKLKEFDLNIKQSLCNAIYNNFNVSINHNKGRYCFASKSDVSIEIENYSRDNFHNVESYVSKFEEWLQDQYMDLCSTFEKEGYKYIEHEQSEEVAKDRIIGNNIEFLKDGRVFNM